MEVHSGEAIKLNIGSGSKPEKGWVNIDLTEGADVVSDVRKLPFPDGYADEAMAIHILEHIDRWEALDTLKEWKRVLKAGSMLAVEVPDLIKCCKWVVRRGDERQGVWGLFGDPSYRDRLMMHRWGWTAQELKAELEAAGFRSVVVRKPKYHRRDRDMRLEAVA